MDDVECLGTEDFLLDCAHTTQHNCAHSEDAGVRCILTDEGQLRLMDGSDVFSGRVQIFFNGTWGNVCGNQWDHDDAQLVCNLLGYGEVVYFTHNLFPFGRINDEPFHLGGLKCRGTERSLTCCPWVHGSCNQENHAGVVCQAENSDDSFPLRLVNGFPDRYSGRVEVFFAGEWGTICSRGWDERDGNVVCSQLGYGKVTAVTGGTFGKGTGPIFLSNLDCLGNETAIVDCVRGGIGVYDQLCDHTNDAEVQCSGPCLHFECSEDVQANLSSAAESVVVLWIEPSIQNDACGQVTVTKSHNPGDAFSEGVTVVSYTFEDTSGSTSSCNFTVTVQRNEARTSQGTSLLIAYVVGTSVAFLMLLVVFGLIWTLKVKWFARPPLPSGAGNHSVHTNPSFVSSKRSDNNDDDVYEDVHADENQNAYYLTPKKIMTEDGDTLSASTKKEET